MAHVKLIKTHEQLNSTGCNLLLQANESTLIRLTSTEMRWLTIKKENSNDYFTDEQKQVCEYISDMANSYGGENWEKLNVRILLYVNPLKKQDEHMKKLIQAGADVRYISMINTTKIVLLENQLFISFARSFDKVVSTGLLYTGNIRNDPLIEYYKKLFDDAFDRARKITLNNGVLVFTDNWLKAMIKCVKMYGIRDWIPLVIGAVLGTILGGIVSLLITLLI